MQPFVATRDGTNYYLFWVDPDGAGHIKFFDAADVSGAATGNTQVFRLRTQASWDELVASFT